MKVRIFTKIDRNAAFLLLGLIAFGSFALAQTPAAKAPVVFTEKDREFALKYAIDTRDDFIKQLLVLSDAQLNFRAADGRWTNVGLCARWPLRRNWVRVPSARPRAEPYRICTLLK